MNTVAATNTEKTTFEQELDSRVLARIAEEGYGPGAWHGPDLRAAVEDVTATEAFWRATPSRHNIAEVVLHHAFYVRSVTQQLTGRDAEPFPLEGSDWFAANENGPLTWNAIRERLAGEHDRLLEATRGLRADGRSVDHLELVLGITCHAAYHAGQVQLLKRLRAERDVASVGRQTTL